MRKVLLLPVVLLLSIMVLCQSRPLTGRITDEKGDPIPFASVKINGTTTGVAADENGFFKINAPQNAVLEVSASGYSTRVFNTSGQGATLAISLNKTNEELAAVVVTTGLGIKRQAKELGYAATSLNSRTLVQGKAVNVQQALNGKVSGVSVATTNSGVFENAKINIRGIRSLTGNNQPMLVIDGAPTPLGYLSSIPPDDIQDLTILKSAASAQIYGPDAVNGVIVVTTKKGTSKKITVNINSTIQAARVAYFPKLQEDFGAGAGEVLDQYGNFGYVPYENQQYGPRFDGSMQDIGVALEDGSIQRGPYSNLHANEKKKFWNTGITYQNSVSLSGDDFYVGIQDAKVKGLMPEDENRRTSIRFNGGKKYGNLTVNYGLNYVIQNYDVVNEAGMAGLLPAYNGSIFFLVMQTPSNVPLTSYKNWQSDKFAQYSNYYNEFAVNPYWIIGNLRQKGREDDLIGNIEASYQFFPWIKGTVRASTNLAFTSFKNTTAPIDVTDWAHDNRNPTQYTDRPGNVFDNQAFTSTLNLDYFVNGDYDINKDFNIKYLAGGMLRQNRAKDVSVGGNNLVVPYLYNVAVRSGDANVPLYPSNANTESRLLSAYGSVGLSFRDWAFIEFTGRNDWDSRLLPDNRSFFYPGVNAAIVLSDAVAGIKNSDLISFAKVRAAYSKSGNVNVGVYSLQSTYSQPGGFPYGNVAGFTANQTIPNPDLKPEFVKTFEIGGELGFLKNRINLEATYFHQQSDNQILQVSQSSTTGYTIGLANAASFKNYGVEMDLGLSPLVNVGKGRIDLKINATYNDNEVTGTLNNIPVVIGGNAGFIQNSVSSPTANNIAVVGKPAFAFQLTDYNRDSLGRVIVDAVTGYPSQASELVVRGRSLPLWVIGVTPSFTLGGLSVSMTWDYKGGHNGYSGLGSDMDFAGISKRSAEYGRQRFVVPNSSYWDGSKYVPNTNIQTADGNYTFWTGAAYNNQIATNYFYSAAAWRLREVNISYNLPMKWFGNQTAIKRITVSAIGRNLLLFVPNSNQWGDPEFNYSATGNTFGLASSYQSPASRLFGGSIAVQF
ncbi:SusC/RagA family TonB-linked outer membrane protein [Paraflavitalea sp. CAU 1676]|uniref:SusC/RagA family TonB-linked outer membrane protein n=1 Tax=Paraflavitalea sp. CAU 1676 TaxID=3032598 RepID=UPI0023DBCE86|nr:SusC/RagA family TonB-linked outer membrane protein [Paraflavitalea sp. CAU 1676]MDF2193337.1 SusC/RagA family TonB-linked outer membrane protein [Paraflavitalea sp. CAU 1676]